jgi:hypothetical protein
MKLLYAAGWPYARIIRVVLPFTATVQPELEL